MALFLFTASLVPCMAEEPPRIAFEAKAGGLQIQIDGRPFAEYVLQDPSVRRPYFANLHAPNGKQFTRNHPPIVGKDSVDHATMHPGIWLAFGDVAGADFWRNKGVVTHVEFVEKPLVDKHGGRFAVKNRYASNGKILFEEICRIGIAMQANGYMLEWNSEFHGPEDFAFGDQEEMGLGVRVATPITVKNGGCIQNADGLKNEKQVWGKQSDWCTYGGVINGQSVGVTLMPAPSNFRRCWFHSRDYGVLVANPFGQNAFTKSPKSKVIVRRGDTFRLRFGILVHSGDVDIAAAYKAWLQTNPGNAGDSNARPIGTTL